MPTKNHFSTELVKQHPDNQARVTKITTPHGDFLTPTFMPVGTRALVNQLTPQDLLATNSQIILGGNTYHMLCSPGLDVIQAAGGMHKFMGWTGPMLTDSGGFQVFSLARQTKLCRLDEQGAHFKHPNTGARIHLTPSSSIATQKVIGADIIMAFDQCTAEAGGREAAVAAMERTHRWLIASKEAHSKDSDSVYGYPQALFGIIQGGNFRDLREQSAAFMLDMELDGLAIGGESIGFDMAKTCTILEWLTPILPANQSRYTMGVGLCPDDLLAVVSQGIDLFDCVAPTRNARHGALYHGEIVKQNNWVSFVSDQPRKRLLIKKSCYARDSRPISEHCGCYTCQNFSRAYLHYLFKGGFAAYNNLACIHNIYVMQAICDAMRECILST